jgi:hypothetical protein
MREEWAFDMAEEAAGRGYDNGVRSVQGELNALLIGLRAGEVDFEAFVARIHEIAHR